MLNRITTSIITRLAPGLKTGSKPFYYYIDAFRSNKNEITILIRINGRSQ